MNNAKGFAEPKPAVTPETIESLAQYGAPAEEIAAYLGLTIEELAAVPGSAQAIEKGDAKRKLLLRQARMKRALAGDENAMRQATQPTLTEAVAEERARRLAEFMAQRAR